MAWVVLNAKQITDATGCMCVSIYAQQEEEHNTQISTQQLSRFLTSLLCDLSLVQIALQSNLTSYNTFNWFISTFHYIVCVVHRCLIQHFSIALKPRNSFFFYSFFTRNKIFLIANQMLFTLVKISNNYSTICLSFFVPKWLDK